MISILLASYNGEKYLAQQIDSLLAQTQSMFTLHIRDDGSTDGTWEIIRRYRDVYPGKIIAERAERNSGSAKHPFMHLMTRVRDDYIFLCDQDDVWLPDKIEKTLGKLKDMEKRFGTRTPLLVHTDLIVVDEHLKRIAPSFQTMTHTDFRRRELRNLLVQNSITGCSAAYNRALAEYITAEPPGIVMHDWWIALVAAAFGNIDHLGEAAILYRQHAGNEIGAKSIRTLRYKLYKLTHGNEIRRALEGTYRQAAAFLRMYGSRLAPPQSRLLREYSEIPNLKKWRRIQTLYRLRTLKYGAAREIAHLLFV
jgi:glycosyltransferase involved in cell wall biosynthesis